MRKQQPDTIRFVVDGEVRAVRLASPTRTVLQVLRDDLGLTGTKEGCAEGDCGACTVVLAEPQAGAVRMRAVNACIQFAATLDARAIITVGGLRDRNDGSLHPVQQAMVDAHASQCGFCTPGFVMSLFALYKSEPRPDRTEINDAIAGNLCRCTGYRPIVAAAERMREIGMAQPPVRLDLLRTPAGRRSALATRQAATLAEKLAGLERGRREVIDTPNGRFAAPRSVAALARYRQQWPRARMLAGGTDVGLWVTKQHRDLGDVIYIGRVPALARIEQRATVISIGAAVTLTDAFEALGAEYPQAAELFRRYASPPIRNAGTLAGNVANGSPIGDSMPLLIALGARVVLRHSGRRRSLPLEDFYLGYQRTALAAGEFVERIDVPRRSAGMKLATWKISKRFDQDISAVCAAFAIRTRAGRIVEARFGFGGVAAIPARARRCEFAVTGGRLDEATRARSLAALETDFEPISDMRASAWYRRQIAQNLLRRAWLHWTQGDVPPASLYLSDIESLQAVNAASGDA